MAFSAKIAKLLACLRTRDYAYPLFRYRVAAAIEHEWVLRNTAPKLIVDVGANRGQFALAALHCCQDARVVAFEPLPEAARIFREVFGADPRVRLYASAIGSARAQGVMHVSARDDSSSLLPITSRQDEIFPGTAEAGTLTVEVAPLGDFLTAPDIMRPALLKLDVQGYELKALQGCESLIGKFDLIYAECSFVELYAGQPRAHEVISWLYHRDFKLIGVYNLSYSSDGTAIQGDMLFGRDPR